MRVRIEELPLDGICSICDLQHDCPMIDLLSTHRQNLMRYGSNYKHTHPWFWEEDAVDEPDANGNEMTWCPLFEKGK